MYGVGAVIEDHDSVFLKLQNTPVMINDYDLSLEEDRESLNAHMRVNYESDMFSVKPRCFCGHLNGGDKVGRICTNCNTVVSTVTEEAFESNLWFTTPPGVEMFINPQMWMLLFQDFNVTGFNPLEWFADRKYTPARAGVDYHNKEIYQICMNMGFPRGLNSLYQNFDAIINTLFNSRCVRTGFSSAKKLENLSKLITKYRNVIFCKYLQMPSKLVFIVESNATGRYASPEIKLAQDAALTVCGAKKYIVSAKDVSYNESVSIKVIKQLSKFYDTYDKSLFAGKPGLIRKNIGGSRMLFTARCVIVSSTGVHDMDEIWLPRCIVIPLFKYHIINRLLANGFSPTDALLKVTTSVKQYDTDVDAILDELEEHGFEAFLLRYPTLRWLSNRKFKCRITRDLDEIAIRISTMSIIDSNADFISIVISLSPLYDVENMGSFKHESLVE